MKKILLSLICITLVMSSVMAMSMSPASITNNINKGSTVCNTITLTGISNSNIKVDTIWNTQPSPFYLVSASQKGVKVSYTVKQNKNNYLVNVCFTPTNKGDNRGILYLTPKQSGNQQIRFGIWVDLKVK